MLPLRLVLDINVVVSAALKPESLQRTTLLLATSKPARLYVSAPILDEYEEVLSRPELGIRRGLRLQLMQSIRNSAHLIRPSRSLSVSTDPDDNIFLECCDHARADFLVTGNRKHFPIFWKCMKVISSRDFVDIVAPHLLG
jgi:putative PIN family toxin of toxin-antitoxin system